VKRSQLDPRTLFETTAMPRRPRPRSPEDDVLAVARGRKPIAYVAMEREAIASSEFLELRELAARRALTVVIDPAGDDMVRVFVTRHGELWRIPAMRALFATAFVDATWSMAAEAQLSTLLGYPPREIATWLAHQRWSTVAWGHKTVYTALDADQRALVERLGRRAFGDAILGATLYAHARSHDLVRRPRVPRGLVLARAALRPEVAARVMTVGRGQIMRGVVRQPIDAALGAPIQLLVANRWR